MSYVRPSLSIIMISIGIVSVTPWNKLMLLGICLRLGFNYLSLRLSLPQYEDFRISFSHILPLDEDVFQNFPRDEDVFQKLPQDEDIFQNFPLSSYRTIGSVVMLPVASGLSEDDICKGFGHWEDQFYVLFQCPFVVRLGDLNVFRSKLNEDSQSSLQVLFQEAFALRLALKDACFAGFTLLQVLSDSNVLTISLLLGSDLNEIAGSLLLVRSLVILFFSIYGYLISALCVAAAIVTLSNFHCCISLLSTIGVEFRGLLHVFSGLSVMFASIFVRKKR